MAKVGTLMMELLANATGFQSGLKQAGASLSTFQRQVQGVSQGVQSRLATILGVGGSAGFLGWGVKLAADAETAQASFSVLAGSAAKARQMLAEIKQFSQASPISQGTLRDAASTMLSFGVNVDNVLPALRQFGDITGGDAERMKSLALAFGQMSSAGRMMGQDLLQMINAGFNPLQEISRKTGESLVELKARMEAGAISSQEVTAAFESATGAGGRFNGRLAAVADTTQGQFNRMKAAAENAAQGLGEALIPAIAKLIETVTPAIKAFANMDEKTRSNIVQFAVLAGGTVIAIVALAKMVDAIRTIVTALRAMAIGQAIVQALSGPKGWAALAASVGVAAIAVAGTAELFKDVTKAIGDAANEARRAAEQAKALGEQSKFEKAAQDANKLAESIGKIEEKATAADEAAKQLADLFERGKNITEQMRTPGEVLGDTAAELRQLLGIGAISATTFQRAMLDARQKAAEARGEFEAIENMRKGVGAAIVGTREGFSAVQTALRNADADKALADRRRLPPQVPGAEANMIPREQLAEARRQREELQGIRQSLDSQRDQQQQIRFQVAEF